MEPRDKKPTVARTIRPPNIFRVFLPKGCTFFQKTAFRESVELFFPQDHSDETGTILTRRPLSFRFTCMKVFSSIVFPFLALTVFSLTSACKKSPPDTLTGAVLLTEKMAKESFDEESGYSNVKGLFDQRIGLIATGRFSGSVNPMMKNETYKEDFKRNLKFVQKVAASGLLSPNLKVIVAFRNQIGEYVRVWQGSQVAEIKDFMAEAEKLSTTAVPAEEGRRMFFYNGIANGMGGYPDWNAVFDWKESLLEDLNKNGYTTAGFILPTFGPVLIVEKSEIEKSRMRSLHSSLHNALYPAREFYPRALLHAREANRFITIVQDLTVDDPSALNSTVYPAKEESLF